MSESPLNSSFSTIQPRLQLAIDSTSLGAFKKCPRYYQLSIVEGWRPRAENIHFIFGLLLHGGRERYDRERANGAPHEEAIEAAVGWLLSETWRDGQPQFFGDSYKNRFTALRTLIWYLDEYGANDPLETIRLSDGRPAVELSFRFDSGFASRGGEPFLLCGHIDRLVVLSGQPYVSDLKTTKSDLGNYYFNQFRPHNQFSLYMLASQVVWQVPTHGLIVDGVRVAVGFSEFQRRLIPSDWPSLEEWLLDTGRWMERMEACAAEGEWPMNETACGHYTYRDGSGGCEFREVCSRSPRQRRAHLEATFERRIWDPLQVRGDV